MPKKSVNNEKKAEFAAVICELNPPHCGHQYLFDTAKKEHEGLVCVLSGNFVQRGDAAIIDKWARTKMALSMGADLVVELPVPWACAGAERFAAGGVTLAAALPSVSTLIFGSECADTELLTETASLLLSEEFSQALKELPDNGEPFAKRRELAVRELAGETKAALLRSPNAILGIEYCKAILQQNAGLNVQAVERIGAGHDEHTGHGGFRSASELRALLKDGQSIGGLVPQDVEFLLNEARKSGLAPVELARLETAILCRLRTMSLADFAALPDVSEGLEHRLFTAAKEACSLEEFFAIAKSKRVSHARLRRLAIAAFLGLTSDLPDLPPYLHVLGLGKRGGEMFSHGAALPILTRPSQLNDLGTQAQAIFQLEALADDLYALASPTPQKCGRTYREGVGKGGEGD